MLLQAFTITSESIGMRLDKAISTLYPNTSRSKIQKMIKTGNATVNGKIVCNLSFSVQENDSIEINMQEEPQDAIRPVNIPIDIVYEDDHVIVINKSVGVNVHPGIGHRQDTLVNALLYHSDELSDIGGEERRGIVHRLDKDTSGLMVVAKTNHAHENLVTQLKNRTLVRKYKALIWGVMYPLSGTIDYRISKNKMDRTKMMAIKGDKIAPNAKDAITHYHTLQIFVNGGISLVECSLETGRTHQIRVHLSASAHSILGDQLYGQNARKIKESQDVVRPFLEKLKHQALHSFYIKFQHPVSNELLEFEKNVPNEYNMLMNKLKEYSQNN